MIIISIPKTGTIYPLNKSATFSGDYNREPSPVSHLSVFVSFLLSHVSCLTSPSHVFCLLSHISCFTSPTLVFYVSCLTTSVSCLTSRYCLTSPSTVSCLLFGGFVSCLTSPSNCLSHVFCLLSVSCILAVSYLAHSPFCPTSTV